MAPTHPDAGTWKHYVDRMERHIFPLLKYEPSEEQMAFHRDPSRVRLVAGGERAGKSFSAAMDLVARAVYMAYMGNERQLYWILGPDYEQPRAEFEYVFQALANLEFPLLGKPTMPNGKSSPWVAHFAKIGEISTKTSSDIRKIASYPPDGVLMAEAAQQVYDAYLKSRGRVAERRGWLTMSGTFESSLGWYAELYTMWQNRAIRGNRSFSLPTWSNRKVYPGGRDDPEIKALEAVTPEDLFMERYGAVPFKPHTLIFREFSYEQNVAEWCEYDDNLPVYLAVDPGYDPGYYHVSAMQIHSEVSGPEQVWQVDEIHVQRQTAPEVIEEAKRRVWWGRVEGGVIDVAGRQHHAQKSQVEIWLELGGVYLRSNPVPILDGIERHRTFLRDPGTGEARLIHNPECVGTLREYSMYKREPDRETRGVKEVPIDRDNHAMKAIAYFLYDRYGPVYRRQRKVGRVATL